MQTTYSYEQSTLLYELLQIRKKKIVLGIVAALIGILLLIVFIEIKHIYEIDLFVNYDFPIDNIYYQLKERLSS